MEKKGTSKAITNFLLHIHPPKVDANAIKFTRTFGLGGISALLIIVLFVTGILLRFVYVPSVAGAYNSIVDLENNVLFGSLLRNMHYWSSTLLVIVAFLHLIRVFYSQSYFTERGKNWIYGLVLFFCVVAMNFTGYLLPWDQLAYWAVTVIANILEYIPIVGGYVAYAIRGGDEVGEGTLLRFYNFHTGLLPIVLIFLMMIHFWLVRKAKGVTVSDVAQKNMVSTNPELVYKEIVAALITLVFIVMLSIFVNAPLQGKADPMTSPDPSKAPWYFMGFQELLLHMHPTVGAFILPLLVTLFFVLIAYFKDDSIRVGVWFQSEIGKKITLFTSIFAFVITFTSVMISESLMISFNELNLLPPVLVSTVLWLLVYILPSFLFLYIIKSKLKANKPELIMAIGTFVFVAYITLTIIGTFLRGPGMKLFH